MYMLHIFVYNSYIIWSDTILLLLFAYRLAENRSTEIARKAPARGVGDDRQQAGRAGPPLGHSREGVSGLPSPRLYLVKSVQLNLLLSLPSFIHSILLLVLMHYVSTIPCKSVKLCVFVCRNRIELDDLIQKEVHNADLSNHDRGCILQWTSALSPFLNNALNKPILKTTTTTTIIYLYNPENSNTISYVAFG